MLMIPRIDGIDISHWNLPCDWSKVPPYKLISLKATEGRKGRDSTFPARWAALRARGTQYRGAYHWIRTDSSVDAQVYNLTSLLDSLGGLQKGEFVQLDWETNVGLPVVPSTWVDEFVEKVNDHYGGLRTIVYSSDWLPDSTLDADSRREFIEWREENPDYPLWYANYALTTVASGGEAECLKYGADVWQWSSTKLVSGFSGGIDVNHVFDWSVLDLVSDQLIIPVIVPQEDPVIYVFIQPQEPEFEFEPGKFGLFTQDGHPVTQDYLNALAAAGAKVSIVTQAPHPWWKEATLHKMGEAARRLYGDTPAS